MISPKKSISELVDDLIESRDTSDQFQIAFQLFRMEPENGRDIQALNRAIYYFRDNHPEVYDRAKNPDLRQCRSIPPSPPGKVMEYFRREEACTALVRARTKWKVALKQKKAGILHAKKRFDREEFANGLSEMGAIGRRKNKAPSAKNTSEARKPKRRLHS